MEVLIVIGLGLTLAVAATLWLTVRLIRTRGGAGRDGRARVLEQFDTDADQVVVSWPTLWWDPSVADVIREGHARGWTLVSQGGDQASHALVFTRER